jgi:type VI secretion system secreted protein Hcp
MKILASKRARRSLVWLGLAMVYALPLLSIHGALDMFLKLDGIDGESTDKVHAKEIDVLSWSWGMSSTSSIRNGPGVTNPGDLSVTKYIDKASPELMFRLLTGQQIPSATLSVRKAGTTTSFDFLTIKLEPVVLTSYTTGGSGGEDRLTENLGLNFGKMSVTYTETKPDGTKGTVVGPRLLEFPTNTPK